MQVALLNGAAPAPPRVVLVGDDEPSVVLGDPCERHLIATGRKAVLVFVPESQQEDRKNERKGKRLRELPEGVAYAGSLPGM